MFVRSQLNGKEGDGGALPTRIKGEKRERKDQRSGGRCEGRSSESPEPIPRK